MNEVKKLQYERDIKAYHDALESARAGEAAALEEVGQLLDEAYRLRQTLEAIIKSAREGLGDLNGR